MKKLLLGMLCASMMATGAYAACGGAASGSGCCTIGVRTNIDKEVMADSATLRFVVETSDKDMAKASEKNRTLSNSVSTALKTSLDTAKGDKIETDNYSIQPIYRYDKDGKRSFERYTVTNNLVITTKNLENIGKLIDTAVAKGVTSVSDLNFDLADKTPYCKVLLKDAAQSAKEQADAIAQSLGKQVTKPHKITASCGTQNVNNSPYRASFAASAEKMDAASTKIEVGTIRVWSDFTGEFKFK